MLVCVVCMCYMLYVLDIIMVCASTLSALGCMVLFKQGKERGWEREEREKKKVMDGISREEWMRSGKNERGKWWENVRGQGRKRWMVGWMKGEVFTNVRVPQCFTACRGKCSNHCGFLTSLQGSGVNHRALRHNNLHSPHMQTHTHAQTHTLHWTI